MTEQPGDGAPEWVAQPHQADYPEQAATADAAANLHGGPGPDQAAGEQGVQDDERVAAAPTAPAEAPSIVGGGSANGAERVEPDRAIMAAQAAVEAAHGDGAADTGTPDEPGTRSETAADDRGSDGREDGEAEDHQDDEAEDTREWRERLGDGISELTDKAREMLAAAVTRVGITAHAAAAATGRAAQAIGRKTEKWAENNRAQRLTEEARRKEQTRSRIANIRAHKARARAHRRAEFAKFRDKPLKYSWESFRDGPLEWSVDKVRERAARQAYIARAYWRAPFGTKAHEFQLARARMGHGITLQRRYKQEQRAKFRSSRNRR